MDPETLLESQHLHTPPVDVVAIAGRLGIEVQTVMDPHWDAALDRGPPARIYVDVACTETRRRFLVARALGHWFLHPEQRAFRVRVDSRGFDAREVEANLFAARLLLPTTWLRAYAIYESGDALARRFHVSRAMLDTWLRNVT